MKINSTLLLTIFSISVQGQISTGNKLGANCIIPNDCQSFCCNNTETPKIEGKCVMMKQWHECEHRKHLTEEVMLTLIGIGIIAITILSMLKVRRKRMIAKALV